VAEDRDTTQFSLTINGHARTYPKNLVRALIQIRDLKLDGYYWIDALCINQLDNRERSAQVNIMDRIYQRAETVDVWLSRSYSDTENVNEILRELLRVQDEYQGMETFPKRPMWANGPEILPEVDWETLVQILSRRWFHRLWTLQEFALGANVNLWCGPHIIQLELLQQSAQFLSKHQIPMTPSYGKSGIAGAAISQLTVLQQMVHSPEFVNLDFRKCFQDLDSHSSIDYESLLAWVYWRSISTFASDPRDYVFGILGIANAIANRMGLVFEPHKADYSLSAAEAFQKFIVRIMNGHFGIRAIALIQPSSDNRTPDLPSWVPDLANRQGFSISTSDGLRSSERNNSYKSVIGWWHDAGSAFSVHGRNLHLQSHRIGKIIKTANSFPSIVDSTLCPSFVVSLISMLNVLPEPYPWTNQSPIDVLLSTMSLDENGTTYSTKAQNSTDFEKWLYNSLQVLVFSKVHNGFSIDDIIDSLEPFSPWTISALSEDFPDREMLRWTFHRNRFAWKNINSTETEKLFTVQGDFCRAFSRRYSRMPGQRLFLLEAEEGGLLGLGPNNLQTGDSLWVTSGSEWPYVFRSREEHSAMKYADGMTCSSIYEFVGEAYVHGIMHGELFRHSAPQWQEIVLR